MAKQKKPFSIQRLFIHKAKPWKRRILTQSDGGLNLIIRRLKCKNASELFSRSLDSTESNYSTRPKYPYLMRNLEQSVNSWPSFEKKCQEYTKQRSKEETPAEEHVEPIIEFPPEEAADYNNLANVENEPEDESKDTELKPTTSGLTRWKNTIELLPSPIVSNMRNKNYLNCSFETVQSSSPSEKPRQRKPRGKTERDQMEDQMSSTIPILDRSNFYDSQSTPAFMREWKRSRQSTRQMHSTPKNAYF